MLLLKLVGARAESITSIKSLDSGSYYYLVNGIFGFRRMLRFFSRVFVPLTKIMDEGVSTLPGF